MQTPNRDHLEKLTVQITHDEKELAKKKARSEGMTFQGWTGKLIKDAIKEVPDGNRQ